MIKRFRYSACLFLTILFVLAISVQSGFAQTTGVKVKGLVLESGSGMPLKQVLVSVSSTGVSAETDENGNFTIEVPDKNAEIIIDLPGFNKRKLFIMGRDSVKISLVPSQYKSFDTYINSPLGVSTIKDATNDVSVVNSSDVDMTRSTSFDQDVQGKIAGLHIIQQSGMPGGKTWMNFRGISSMYGKNQPLLFIDGMVHDYDYTNLSLMEGFSLNAMDVIDIEDMTDITFLKNGEAYLGSIGSNGVININSEQKSEASTVINVSAYTGMALTPASQEVLDAGEYRSYLNQYITDNGLPADYFPWLNGGPGSTNYYKYNNSTDWQKEIFKTATLNKAHLFIKGGDEIATYNISTGYVKQNALYDKSNFSRFNLRINGKVNISDRFSVAPNAKLSLSDSYLPNMGASVFKNPLLSALLKPSNTAIYARDPSTGVQLPFLDDVGDINVSNPVALIRNLGTNRNYNFLSSVNLQYRISSKLVVSSLTGIDFNNSRESIFLPDLGVAQVDSAYNSPQDFASEYRSMQNHSTLNYANKTATGHSYDVNVGLRFIENTYKNVKLIALNTASDYLKNLDDGTGTYKYLRTTNGDDKGLLWLSYFATFSYDYMNKFYLNTNLSYDGNSATAEENRYNFYPSVSAAYRITSGSESDWLEDLKLRASWSQSGNIFSSAYDYSKLFYMDGRFANRGILSREAIPNEDMEVERKNTIDIGADLSLNKQVTNIHLDLYLSMVNNLIINQKLPVSYGFTDYFDNGGNLINTGVELAFDHRHNFGEFIWTLGGTVTMNKNEIIGLNFINPLQNKIITDAEGAQYVTIEGEAVNSFYGYKTNGIFTDVTEANSILGPNGTRMKQGDIRFVDADNNGIINDLDKTVIGNPNPDLFGGINTSFSYKGLELSALFTYSIGNDAYNYVKYKTESMIDFSNQASTILQRGSGDVPTASLGDPSGNSLFSDRWIEDASYARLKKLTLSYSKPGKKFYKSVTLFATVTNLFTFTNYSGYDPEFMYMSNPFVMGIDYGQMPQVRSFIVGLKLGL